MRNLFIGLVATLALMIANTAQAGFLLKTDTVNVIPGNNNFKTDLNAFKLDKFTQGPDQTLDITSDGSIEFFFEGKEAGFTNQFKSSIAGITFEQANDTGWNGMTVPIGSGNFKVGDLMNDWLFNSLQGVNDQGIATNAFGIFFNSNDFIGQGSGAVDIGNIVYLGFDDQGKIADDNHDDLIIKAVFTASVSTVPEPFTLGLLGVGLFGLGFSRKHRKA